MTGGIATYTTALAATSTFHPGCSGVTTTIASATAHITAPVTPLAAFNDELSLRRATQ
ncbi:MAG TPA: hypothetical protein VMA09_11700 [Candidatus Binataceae bacterium]|nr:hypothetical protein [Candidatus Binataceae bacterium]